MANVRSLRPNVTREEATRHFTAGVANVARDLFRGRVRSIAELYIPYRFFRVTVRSSGRRQEQIFAIDAVDGSLDLFEFPAFPSDVQLYTVETRNLLQAAFDVAESRERLVAKIRRIIFMHGFFRVRDLEIDAEPIPGELCVPYWVAFRGVNGRASITVLDAVRRRSEGGKVRQMVEAWLQSAS